MDDGWSVLEAAHGRVSCLHDAGRDLGADHLAACGVLETPLDGDLDWRVLAQHVHAGGEAELGAGGNRTRAGRQRAARLPEERARSVSD